MIMGTRLCFLLQVYELFVWITQVLNNLEWWLKESLVLISTVFIIHSVTLESRELTQALQRGFS